MPNVPANLKFLSQTTGEFVEQGSEPAWTVNMDDDDALAFVDRQRAALGLLPMTPPAEPVAESAPVAPAAPESQSEPEAEPAETSQAAPPMPEPPKSERKARRF